MSRVGNTWILKLFDTAYNTSVRWEPDNYQGFAYWPFTVDELLRKKLAKPHQKIDPEFKKKEIDTYVYKIQYPLHRIGIPGIKKDEFEQAFYGLKAKCVHVIRDPLRWIASVSRWLPPTRNNESNLIRALDLYKEKNEMFFELYKGNENYLLAKHDQLVEDVSYIKIMLRWAGLKPNKQLDKFLVDCYEIDTNDNPHDHSVYAYKQNILNRWQTLPSKVKKHAEKIIDQSYLWEEGCR